MTTREPTESMVFDPLEVPLEWAEEGQVIRIRGTRVPLETVLHQHLQKESPESIAEAFSAVKLSDVYAVIAYYLRNKASIDAYLAESARKGDLNEQELRAKQRGLKEKLLARRAALENKHS